MKQLIISLILALFASVSCFAQDEFFAKYEGKQNVEVAFISKSMLEAMKKNGKTIGKNGKEFEALRILETESKDLVSTIKNDALKTFSNANGYEDFMRINEGGETSIIRQKKLKNGRSTFILISYEESSASVLAITGKNLQLKDIQRMK